MFARFRNAAVTSFDLNFSSARRGLRELAGVIRPGDQRWRPIEKTEMEQVTLDRFRDFYAPLLAPGPVHAIIVGDVTLDQAVDAVRRSVAGLPTRPETPAGPRGIAVAPPAPNAEPRTFTHQGDPDQAYALIGWSTFGGNTRTHDRRALALAANMFETRLFDRLREREGATYAPDAVSLGASAFPIGVFYAAAEVRPANVAILPRRARDHRRAAAHPALPDEFARAQIRC